MSRDHIPLAVPDLNGREGEYLRRCVDDNWVSSAGPDVDRIEAEIARLTGSSHGVATSSGTAALHLALLVVGVGPGDRVIIPDWTFAATANAVLIAGADPVFVDVTRESWTLDPKLLAAVIDEVDPKAVVPVHALGHPADMDPIVAVCAERGMPVVEDAAGAIGARYRDRVAGGLGDAAIFSFNGNKTVTSGGGGALVTDRADWAERARALSAQARDGKRYRYREPAFNYRMPNVNAALGLAQLERLDQMLAAKNAIAERYDAAFAGREDLEPMPRCSWAGSSCWLYSVRCADQDAASSLVDHLDGAGVEARLFWEALSAQEPYASYPSHRTGVAASLSGTVVSLPCSSHLPQSDQARVIDRVGGWRGLALKDAA